MGIHIRRNADIVADLYKRFAARRMSMTENNAQQADVLDGAHVVPNANGTAPAQWLDTVFGGHRKILLLLPGPPLELKPIFEDGVHAAPARSLAAALYRHAHAEGRDDRRVGVRRARRRRSTSITPISRPPSSPAAETSSSP